MFTIMQMMSKPSPEDWGLLRDKGHAAIWLTESLEGTTGCTEISSFTSMCKGIEAKGTYPLLSISVAVKGTRLPDS